MLGEPDDGRNRRLGYMASLHLAALFMKLGMQVIMEGLFIDTKNIHRAFELGAEMGYRVFMFELTATIADIAERNSHAGRKPVGDLDGLLAFLGDRYGADTRAVQIDTSSMSIDMALGKIMDVLGVLS